jgi:hypothetical protein
MAFGPIAALAGAGVLVAPPHPQGILEPGTPAFAPLRGIA